MTWLIRLVWCDEFMCVQAVRGYVCDTTQLCCTCAMIHLFCVLRRIYVRGVTHSRACFVDGGSVWLLAVCICVCDVTRFLCVICMCDMLVISHIHITHKKLVRSHIHMHTASTFHAHLLCA